MFNRIAKAFRSLRIPSIAEIEYDYIAGAVSIHDLERREREVDQGLFRRRSAFDM